MTTPTNTLRLPLDLSIGRLACVLLGILLLIAPAASAQQINGVAEADDEFGTALAIGDFDCDGHNDLAVGVPGESIGSATEAGAVNVIYGTTTGLTGNGDQVWSQNINALAGVAEDFDRFGHAVAAGDFDNDGCDDLAVGAPFENIEENLNVGNAGAVNVIYGSPSGLTTDNDQIFRQDDLSGTNPEPDDRFGWSLAVGDFDGDGYDDLAVGSPYEDQSSTNAAGVIHVLFGSGGGLTTIGNLGYFRNQTGHGMSNTFDLFGWSLAAGDFNADGRDDLAIGMIGCDPGGNANAGCVVVLHGTASGFDPDDTLWSQATPGIDGVAEPGDQFGYALATGDFGNDGDDDLAIGVPFEHVGNIADAGAVNVIYGGPSGLAATTDQQLWRQGADGILGVAEAGDRFGFALATGDFGDTLDGYADLVVGVPGESVGAIQNAGAVNAIYGAFGGLSATNNRLVHQNRPTGVKDVSETDDAFGSALAAANFDQNGREEVIVGVPGETVNGQSGAGAAHMVSFTKNKFFHQDATLRPAGDDEFAFVAANPVDIRARDLTLHKDGEAKGTSEPEIAPEAESSALPEAVSLHAAYPNPFAARTMLGFTLTEAGPVRLVVYDALGREIARLVDATREAGEHTVAFDASHLPSGTYVVRLEAGGAVQTQRLTLLQ